VKQYFVGGALALALAAVVVAGLLLFTDLRVTDQSAKEEATALFLEGTDQAEVPDVRGTPIPAAGDAIRNAGFHPLLGRRGLAPFSAHLHKPPPLVQGQKPPAGTIAKIGSTVTMYVTGN
jgi:beta-lactam-binding protein with PASTA domain